MQGPWAWFHFPSSLTEFKVSPVRVWYNNMTGGITPALSPECNKAMPLLFKLSNHTHSQRNKSGANGQIMYWAHNRRSGLYLHELIKFDSVLSLVSLLSHPINKVWLIPDHANTVLLNFTKWGLHATLAWTQVFHRCYHVDAKPVLSVIKWSCKQTRSMRSFSIKRTTCEWIRLK